MVLPQGLRDREYDKFRALGNGSTAVAVTLVSGIDVEIGAVEIKGATNNYRVDVQLDNGSLVGSPFFSPVGGVYNAAPPTYTDGDAVVSQYSEEGKLLVKGDAVATTGNYSNARGDFTATANNGAKTITITGLPFTLLAEHIVAGGSIKVIDTNDEVTDVPLTDVAVSSGVITLADKSSNFASTDTVIVELKGPDKSYDSDLDVQKTIDQSPTWSRYQNEQIVNLTSGTASSSSTVDMRGYSNYSFQLEIGSPAGSVYLLYTNDTAASPTYQDVTVNVTGSTHLSVDVFKTVNNVGIRQLQVVTSGAPTTTDVYLYKWY